MTEQEFISIYELMTDENKQAILDYAKELLAEQALEESDLV